MSFVLLVEPDEDSAAQIEKALAGEGLQIRRVGNPDEALQVAAAQAPKLVIVNGGLLRADQVLRSFSRHAGGPGAVALVDGSVSAGRALSLDADEWLQKPFGEQDLRDAVHRCWSIERANAPSRESGEVLSSTEIFGDLLVELESQQGGTQGVAPESSEPGGGSDPAGPDPAGSDDVVSSEVDALLADTLAGLDLSPTKTHATAPAAVGRESDQKAKKERDSKAERAAVEPSVDLERPLEVEPLPELEPRVAMPAADEPSPETPEEPALDAPREDVVEPVAAAVAPEELEVLSPADGVVAEEEDSRGRTVLLGAIAVVVVIGIVLLLLLQPWNESSESTVDTPESQAPSLEETDDDAAGAELPALDSPVAEDAADSPAQEAEAGPEEESPEASQAPPTAVSAPSTPPRPTPQKVREPVAAPPQEVPGPAEAPTPLEPGAETSPEEVPSAEPPPADPTSDAAPPAADQGVEIPGVEDAGPITLADLDALEASLEEEAAGIDEAEAATADAEVPELVDETGIDTPGPAPSEAPVEEAGDTAAEGDAAAEESGGEPTAETVVTEDSDDVPAEASEETVTITGSGVVPPQLVNFDTPRVPEIARRLRRSGVVIVRVLVDENGDVVEAELVQKVIPQFDAAVLKAARRAQFVPGTQDGQPVKMWRNLEVRLQADS